MYGSVLFIVVAASAASSCHCSFGDLSQASVLVTGAAGFIGSHLVMKLNKAGCKSIVGMDNFDAYYDVYLKRLRADMIRNVTNLEIINGDVCDAKFLENLFSTNTFTHVVHLAAQPGVRYSFVKPLSYIRNNIECFTTLMEQVRLRKNPVSGTFPRVLYASSSSVYGLNEKIPFSEEDPVLHPSNLYGATKRADELIAHSYHHLYGITTVGFRFFTVYGPRGRPDMAAALFTEGIMSGKPITLFNNGELVRDYTYVDDIADGLMAAVARVEDDKFLMYNLGNKKPVTTNNFLSILEKYLGKKANVRYEPSRADMAITFANTTLAYTNLGFVAKTSLEVGLKNYIDWYRTHETNLMSCLAECSDEGFCFNGGWAEPARTSRAATEQCSHVYYTVSSLLKTDNIKAAPAENIGCNIAFVNRKSVLYQKAVSDEVGQVVYSNWILIPINEMGNMKDIRRNSRLPKLNPGKFFAPSVEYALYCDPTISLVKPVKAVIDKIVSGSTGMKAVLVASSRTEQRAWNIQDEIDNVIQAMKNYRKGVISEPIKIKEQSLAYKSYQYKHDGLKFDNIFDGIFLLHDLKSPTAKKFRCRWYREYQKWSDREQISGGFVLGMMNYEHDPEAGGRHANWVSLGADGEQPVYAHLLDSKHHLFNTPSKSKSGYFFRAR